MQGAESEGDGSILKYMTEAESRKQRCSSPFMTQPRIALAVTLPTIEKPCGSFGAKSCGIGTDNLLL